MWADRQYDYYSGPPRPAFPPSMMRSLLISLIAVFVVQLLADAFLQGGFSAVFGLSRWGLGRGFIWQPVTYIWLHSGRNLFHLLFNLLGLYVFGRDLERAIGSKAFLWLFTGSGLAGGLGWVVLSGAPGAVCIGASGAVFGIMAAFATFYPERRITLLLFFVIPVTLAAKWLALGLAAFTLFALFGTDGQIAHAAHLGGGLAGYLYARRRIGLPWLPRFSLRGLFAGGGWRRRSQKRNLRLMPDDEDLPPSPEIVDEILEKLHREGLPALTARERRILERASRAARR